MLLIFALSCLAVFVSNDSYYYHELSEPYWLIPGLMLFPALVVVAYSFVAGSLSVPRWIIAIATVPSLLPLISATDISEAVSCSIGVLSGGSLYFAVPVKVKGQLDDAATRNVHVDAEGLQTSTEISQSVHNLTRSVDQPEKDESAPSVLKYILAWLVSGAVAAITWAVILAAIAASGAVKVNTQLEMGVFLLSSNLVGSIIFAVCGIWIYNLFSSLRLWKVFPWMVSLGFIGSWLASSQIYSEYSLQDWRLSDDAKLAGVLGVWLGYFLGLSIFAGYFEARQRPVLKKPMPIDKNAR